jgi:hypothetical protein
MVARLLLYIRLETTCAFFICVKAGCDSAAASETSCVSTSLAAQSTSQVRGNTETLRISTTNNRIAQLQINDQQKKMVERIHTELEEGLTKLSFCQ